MKKIEFKKKICKSWFQLLRNQICQEIQLFETEGAKFKKNKWARNKSRNLDLGGGEMSILRGNTFEKAGVNISTVFGSIPSELKGKIPGSDSSRSFWASGISVVIHPFSPKIPAVHMNTRFIVTNKCWFGGGMDITPSDLNSKESKDLASFFHKKIKVVCDKYGSEYYKKYKKWCDEYFYLPHRGEPRGLGGIFYDYLNSDDWEKDFEFTKEVGKTFIETYSKIVSKTINLEWNEKDKNLQFHRRSRYTEFNLLHDRGTKFGLQTKGNVDAILMSLPPSTGW
tara:strand:- start:570 stop:1415 length:846 start_codon:yes stop_codon:yes gene_type:complete